MTNSETHDSDAKERDGHGSGHHKFQLIINKKPYEWDHQLITGAEIKRLAGSPPDWVVNEHIPGPGEEPEIADGQKVDLDLKAPPPGVKKFTTRKPTTSPGAR
jgi:Multiubiquitin